MPVTAPQAQLQLTPHAAQHWLRPSAVVLGTPPRQIQSYLLFCSSFFLPCSSVNSSGINCHLPCHTAGMLIRSFSLSTTFSPFPSLSLCLLPSFSLTYLSLTNLSLVSEPMEDKNGVVFTFVSAAHTKVSDTE